jgi:release factor glutamine methyltransferase
LTIRTALLQGTKLLEEAGILAPRLTAEVLLGFALRREREYLYGHSEDELAEVAWIHYGRYLHQRMSGMPTQYITKRQEFCGREFRVTPAVLIPRPETEHVVEAALKVIQKSARVLDVGTGSGALAATLALETGGLVFATDISAAALSVAVSNARILEAPVAFAQCDLASAFAAQSIDVLISNPPYVAWKDKAGLQREVRDFEPGIALFADEDGLAVYRRLIEDAARVLAPGGWMVLELGYESAGPVKRMFEGSWREIETVDDLAGIPRVITARFG